jgi:hypothetical protein
MTAELDFLNLAKAKTQQTLLFLKYIPETHSG